MTNSNNLAFALIASNQSQKEVTANVALVQIDAILNVGVIDLDLATPPGSPAEGDLYIVAAGGTGDWATHDGDVTYFSNGAWVFIDPNAGFTLWVTDENTLYTFDGANWIPSAGISVFISGGSKQILLNKTAFTDSASFIFQSALSSRAEFGLIGSDDFGLKVSPDGTTFYQALEFDNTTGNIDLKQNITASGGDITITFEIYVGQGSLASAGTVTLIDALVGDQYKIVDLMLSGGGTNFSGGGGDRNLSIQDTSGTVTYGIIPAATLQAIAPARWGDTGLAFPVSVYDFHAATTAGEDLVVKYSGGSADYTAGDLTLRVTAKKFMPSSFVTVGQGDVAAAAQKTLLSGSGADQFRVTNITLAGSGTNFSGGGGDRDLAIQDASGTTVYAIIPAAILQAIAFGTWGGTEVPYPVTITDIVVSTVAGEDLVAAYTGGTTDYTAGSLSLTVDYKKVA